MTEKKMSKIVDSMFTVVAPRITSNLTPVEGQAQDSPAAQAFDWLPPVTPDLYKQMLRQTRRKASPHGGNLVLSPGHNHSGRTERLKDPTEDILNGFFVFKNWFLPGISAKVRRLK
jgi:hypothetical protein